MGFLMWLVLATLPIPAVGGNIRATGISKQPTIWHGQQGRAVTITFAKSIAMSSKTVSFTYWIESDAGVILAQDVPVIKQAPRDVTVFFNDKHAEGEDPGVIDKLFEGTKAGALTVRTR